MRRVLVVAVAALLGAGVLSSIAHAAPGDPAPARPAIAATVSAVVDVVEDAPVCTAEQTEASSPSGAGAGSTVVSFTLVDPRCGP